MVYKLELVEPNLEMREVLIDILASIFYNGMQKLVQSMNAPTISDLPIQRLSEIIYVALLADAACGNTNDIPSASLNCTIELC